MIISYSTSKYVYFWPLYMYIVNLTHISRAAALCWLSNTFDSVALTLFSKYFHIRC